MSRGLAGSIPNRFIGYLGQDSVLWNCTVYKIKAKAGGSRGRGFREPHAFYKCENQREMHELIDAGAGHGIAHSIPRQMESPGQLTYSGQGSS